MVKRRRHEKFIAVAGVKIKIPQNVSVVEAIDLEKLFRQSHRSGKRNDILLILEHKNTRFAVIIEETGRPDSDDVNRLNKMPSLLRDMGIIDHSMMIIRIIHHGGVRSHLVSMARSYKIELQECRHGHVDIDLIFRKRRLLRK